MLHALGFASRSTKRAKTWITGGALRPFKFISGNLHFTFRHTFLPALEVTQARLKKKKKPAVAGYSWLLLHRGFSSINHGFFQPLGGMFINAAHLKLPAQAITHRCLPWILSKTAHTLTLAFSLGSLFVPYD